MLDNARKRHVQNFNEKVNEMMNIYQLKQCVIELKHVSNEQTYNKLMTCLQRCLIKLDLQ